MFLRQLVKNVAASEWLTANGATGRTRTDGLRITNALLYQLSHSSIFNFYFICFSFKTILIYSPWPAHIRSETESLSLCIARYFFSGKTETLNG